MRSDPTLVMPVAGVAEPVVVMMEPAESPPAGARLDQAPGRRTRLWVTLGRIGFDVRDHAALRSTLVAFRRADNLAASVFLPTPEERACEQAARLAGRLFATPAAPRPFVAAARQAVQRGRRGIPRPGRQWNEPDELAGLPVLLPESVVRGQARPATRSSCRQPIQASGWGSPDRAASAAATSWTLART